MSQKWRRSRFCGTNACVEIAELPESFLVRDSKEQGSAVLQFSRREWGVFVTGLKAGLFDNQ
ncbi:DUF397 domain-containing protein [Dactylosporangium fulvum]|uniref:DUF397 domain-containing protein n=1 Tax=Dactylosporangium fulvum TaxID=53359 RepID=A0ABY5WCB4_9ACTN|nr:DUF397 domain-containing protein [Dactylosporangium fulvum]UWP87723.1 DUF397 domain-containing protein [Dactylosporangium fulvum]